MDNSKPLKDSANLLDDLESIRQLLGDDTQQSAAGGEGQIPLLFDVVGGKPALVTEPDSSEDDADIPILMPEPAVQPASPAVTAAPVQAASKEDALLHLDTELRAAAQLIMQDVIDDFAPHIETEIKRRLEARMERLLSQYQN
jgi:hypothetical protein